METNNIEGFKGFDKDLQCRNMQYAVGETFEIEKDKTLKICPDREGEAGLHFCENPIDVFGYYPPADSRYCAVVGSGESKKENGDSKVASSRLFIKTEITLRNLIDAAVKFTFERVDWTNAKESNTGDQSAATNTGYQSAATNTGYQSAATNTGNQSAATNTGNRSAATNTGDQSAATNTGYQSAATNTGYQSAATNTGYRSAATNTGYRSAATNTGYRSAATVEGAESVAISIGIEGKARGKKGCFIVLADWSRDENYTWHRTNVLSYLVDGETIKEDVFYTISNGKLTVAE